MSALPPSSLAGVKNVLSVCPISITPRSHVPLPPLPPSPRFFYGQFPQYVPPRRCLSRSAPGIQALKNERSTKQPVCSFPYSCCRQETRHRGICKYCGFATHTHRERGTLGKKTTKKNAGLACDKNKNHHPPPPISLDATPLLRPPLSPKTPHGGPIKKRPLPYSIASSIPDEALSEKTTTSNLFHPVPYLLPTRLAPPAQVRPLLHPSSHGHIPPPPSHNPTLSIPRTLCYPARDASYILFRQLPPSLPPDQPSLLPVLLSQIPSPLPSTPHADHQTRVPLRWPARRLGRT